MLVLDGDERSAHQISEVLMNAGLDVETVHTAEDLLQRISGVPSTVLVVNIPVPGMSESVLLSLASRVTGVKVMPIVLSSRIYAESSSVAKTLLAQGAVDFVGRPASSARWRSALSTALTELQTESAKLASLKQSSGATTGGEFSAPPTFPGAVSFRAGGEVAVATNRSGDPSPRPKGDRAFEVLSAPRRMELEGQGFMVPEQALSAELLGGGPWAGVMLLWSVDPGQVTLACVEHDVQADTELRLGFRFTLNGTSHQPRLLVRARSSTSFGWGSLVEFQVIGAAPEIDFSALLTLQPTLGEWALELGLDGL